MTINSINIKEVTENLDASYECLICSASFEEERCMAIPSAIKIQILKKAIICIVENLSEKIPLMGEALKKLFGEKAVPVMLDTSNPIESADELIKNVDKILPDESARLFVDITTFTHEYLLILFKVLSRYRSNFKNITFGYTAADEYDVGTAKEEKWLSKGVSEIRSVLGYPGEILPSEDIHLIILAGFETDRVAKMIEAYEPKYISVGDGLSCGKDSDAHEDTNKHFIQKLKTMYPQVETFSFPCYDVRGASIIVDEQVLKYPNAGVVVAPMNNKISTLGAALSAINNPKIQLCYAQANEYNYDKYSSASTDCYIFRLDSESGETIESASSIILVPVP
jgi:hypothetical protein